MTSSLRGWWGRDRAVTARDGWGNVVIGVACGLCAVLDIRLGLESLGRWYLGYFAVVLAAWGALAVRLGRDAADGRPLRLAGDVIGWAGMIGFAVIGLLLDPAEYPALITLVGFAVVVAVMTLVGRRRSPPSPPRSPSS